MKISPYPFSIRLPESKGRSEGMHLSTVVRDIGLQMGYIPQQYVNTEIDPVRVSLGLAFEDWVFPTQHPEVAYHPGEMNSDRIACSADGVSWFGQDMRVHECKLTWKSMKKEKTLENEWLWLSQTMGYCYVWGTQFARYHIYWVNGDYSRDSPTGGPQYKLYDLEFTQRELEDNWTMIKNRAKMLRV